MQNKPQEQSKCCEMCKSPEPARMYGLLCILKSCSCHTPQEKSQCCGAEKKRDILSTFPRKDPRFFSCSKCDKPFVPPTTDKGECKFCKNDPRLYCKACGREATEEVGVYKDAPPTSLEEKTPPLLKEILVFIRNCPLRDYDCVNCENVMDGFIKSLLAQEREEARKEEREKVVKIVENMNPPKLRIWTEDFQQGWEEGKKDVLQDLTPPSDDNN